MNSYLLCVETATEVCSVAVCRGEEVCSLREAPEAYRHASLISVLIREALADADLPATSLAGVAVSRGPGSYTALRVGLSAAKGLCYGLQIPLLAIDTLQALSRAAASEVQAHYFIPMIDARRMEAYTAVFDRIGEAVRPAEAQVLEPDSFDELRGDGRKLAFFGNGAGKYRELVGKESDFLFPHLRCSARHLAVPAAEAYAGEEFQNLAYFSPYYLKPPHITTPKKVL